MEQAQEPTRNTEPHRGLVERSVGKLGALATIIYLSFVAYYLSNNLGDFFTLAPNELGDFLAGIFAPLAFMWLVLGFLQQGVELRHSSKALWLQGEELRNSVEQQRELVLATREQLAFDSKMLAQQYNEVARNSQPILKLVPYGSGGGNAGKREYFFQLTNHGKPCTDLRVNLDGILWAARPKFETGEEFNVTTQLFQAKDAELEVSAQFLDTRLVRGETKMSIVKRGQDFNILYPESFELE